MKFVRNRVCRSERLASETTEVIEARLSQRRQRLMTEAPDERRPPASVKSIHAKLHSVGSLPLAKCHAFAFYFVLDGCCTFHNIIMWLLILHTILRSTTPCAVLYVVYVVFRNCQECLASETAEERIPSPSSL